MHKIDVWEACYPSQWKGKITEEAMIHPAKFSSKLIRKIYDHITEEGWAKSGDFVVDPFGGVALGALDALRLGLNWRGVELEEKFVKIGNSNIELWETLRSRMPRWGTAVLYKGDSRKLLDAIQNNIQASISSPPFVSTLSQADRDYSGLQSHLEKKNKRTMKRSAEMMGSGDYGSTPGQLAKMKDGGFFVAISSPPFLQSSGGSSSGPSKYANDKTLLARHAAGNKGSKAYGDTKGQLSGMDDKGFEVAISSPPFENQEGSMNSKKFKNPKKTARELSEKLKNKTFKANYASPEAILRGMEKRNEMSYGESLGQLGIESGNDFWLAAREIVQQVYISLVPGGHACWVVKDYVKNKQVVEFCDQWRQLCESVGFKTLHEHRATLIRDVRGQYDLEGNLIMEQTETKSLFRRIYEKKGGHRIDWETVFCMEKPKKSSRKR